MSSVTTQCSDLNINSFTISIVLKWTLKAKQLKALSSRKVPALYSDLYKFKAIKDLSFCFCMEYRHEFYPFPYELTVKGSRMWSFKLRNHFALTKNRAYYFMPTHELLFLDGFYDRCIPEEEENVEVHCVVNVWPVELRSRLKDEPLDCQITVDIESIPRPFLPKDYTNQEVISFMQKGEIPPLTVDMALQIISETNIHKCDVLKILCMEYLMKNTNIHNI